MGLSHARAGYPIYRGQTSQKRKCRHRDTALALSESASMDMRRKPKLSELQASARPRGPPAPLPVARLSGAPLVVAHDLREREAYDEIQQCHQPEDRKYLLS